ncbi:MAG: 1-acyl-sn-glycerol-3-phosphate acyltransferase [Acidobacteria bacterium]|nr:MAG: 1-acyl-sn-glycerol-3-phosphate acyltransferase [Acidobacteriota bacterium]
MMLGFWAAALPVAALLGFPWTFLTGRVDFLYRMAMWGAWTGVRLTGVQVETVGLDRIDPRRSYIFMCNHVSNIDPPIVIPAVPKRTSVLVKKEVFRIPVLATAMRMGQLVPVDRTDRDSAITSLKRAEDVLALGVNMTVFPEGTRSNTGEMLPFKKGPFYMALEAGVPVLPMTILGTRAIWPKGSMAIKPGTATVVFHSPIHPNNFPDREALMEAVRTSIASVM